jgi:ATPase subunit of ABC transporter with duplicated ATPase domains
MAESNLTLQQQQERLDDTDLYAVAWADALERYKNQSSTAGAGGGTGTGGGLAGTTWGGRGQGGRGWARRTYQRHDCSVPNVTLAYLGGSAGTLLDSTTLKLLAGHVYGLVGESGKSTLLRRIQARKIPGFPPHLSTLYLHRDLLSSSTSSTSSLPVVEEDNEERNTTGVMTRNTTTASSWLRAQRGVFMGGVKQDADAASLEKLQVELEKAIEKEDEDLITSLAEQMAFIEDDDDDDGEGSSTVSAAIEEQLKSIPIDPNAGLHELSPGQQQRLLLSLIPLCKCDIFLLDNPTANLDIAGLLWLRSLMGQLSSGVVVLASGDVDLLNDVATDIMQIEDQKLRYYAGNYKNFIKQREQLEREQDRVASTIGKKQVAMKQTLDNIRKQPPPRRGVKKSKQLSSHKKRLDRELAHVGDPNCLSSTTKRIDHDKALQFRFRPCMSRWNEPLIVASDVELRVAARHTHKNNDEADVMTVVFDCVDFCLKEGGTHILVGAMASGKTSLLRILAKILPPTAGDVLHAPALNVVLVDRESVAMTRTTTISNANDARVHATVLSFMTNSHPSRSAQDIREQLANFGLGPDRVETAVGSLSDGEMFRLYLASATLQQEVHVLMLDDPTAFLDVDSIDALVHGLNEWNGTLIVSSHDANFIRSLADNNNDDDGGAGALETFALLPREQKLRRVPGGIDEYLRSYSGGGR